LIAVDSSVWIDHLRGVATREIRLLDHHLPRSRIVLGDIVRLELLRGCPDERDANNVAAMLDRFVQATMLDHAAAARAAAHYRRLRRLGITLRKTADLIIATWCIDHRVPLLHRDRDYDGMATHLGLVTVQ
jgi:hypothetical protein